MAGTDTASRPLHTTGIGRGARSSFLEPGPSSGGAGERRDALSAGKSRFLEITGNFFRNFPKKFDGFPLFFGGIYKLYINSVIPP